MRLILGFRTAHVSPWHGENIADTLLSLVTSMVGGSSEVASQIEVCSPQDRQRIFARNAAYPETIEACVHDLFRAQVSKHAGRTAIYSSDGTLTYEALDERSDRLAATLVALGARSETFVPFCFEKGMHAVIAMLAIIKAGAAFVPLDQAYPESRFRHIIETVNADIIVVSDGLHSKKFDNLVRSVVVVDQGGVVVGDLPLSNLRDVKTSPSSAVAAIFTSGSTGVPKAIRLQHSALSTSLMRHAEAQKTISSSRVLQFAAFVFDQSISDIFAPLSVGGCVCIPSEEQRLNSLASFMREARVNWTHLTPTMARLIRPEEVPDLKVLVLGGEAMGKDNISTWLPHVQLLNGYGPAECCVCSSVALISTTQMESTNIGFPHGGDRIWITNPGQPDQLLPTGAVGEMLIEGPILAQGYINNSEAEAAFVRGPKWSNELASPQPRRFYRTGDLARSNPDGSLTFVGK